MDNVVIFVVCLQIRKNYYLPWNISMHNGVIFLIGYLFASHLSWVECDKIHYDEDSNADDHIFEGKLLCKPWNVQFETATSAFK